MQITLQKFARLWKCEEKKSSDNVVNCCCSYSHPVYTLVARFQSLQTILTLLTALRVQLVGAERPVVARGISHEHVWPLAVVGAHAEQVAMSKIALAMSCRHFDSLSHVACLAKVTRYETLGGASGRGNPG